ncbi:MAG: M1 family aminopeptidase, partial [Ginsengibacter sp.]
MKIGLLLLSILFSTAYAKSQPAKGNFIDSISQMEQVANTQLTMLSSATASYTNFDVTYYRCEWNVDPATRYIEGAVTSYFRVPANTDSIIYDLMDDLAADSILQRGNRLLFQHNNNQIVIYFANTVLATTIDSVTIYYHGIPANTGFGSFINSSHSGTPVMWTLSEPYGSRDWWPCKNGLDDKADSIDVIITTPVQYTAASNGLRQSVVIENNKKITHWKHQYPIATYLICMAITNYEEFTTEVRLGTVTLPMQTFCYPESLQTFLEKTPLVLNSMQYFNNFLGTYPFIREKYGHVQFGWGGGQEHQTATFVVAPDENLMSHELAHQWFGDKVTCGSWQDIWLNEGFATHLASMDYENKYPLTISTNRAKEIVNITSLPGGSVFVDD